MFFLIKPIKTSIHCFLKLIMCFKIIPISLIRLKLKRHIMPNISISNNRLLFLTLLLIVLLIRQTIFNSNLSIQLSLIHLFIFKNSIILSNSHIIKYIRFKFSWCLIRKKRFNKTFFSLLV